MSKKNFSLLLILTPLMIALAFAVANFFWRVSYIIGLDNISPYWGLEILVYRAFHSGNFFLYGPSLFNLPVIFAGLIGLTPSILSKLNTALPFIVGMAGYIVLVRLSLGASVKEKRTAIREAFSLVSGLLLVIGSLISIWIFNQPVTIFLAMFAALPWTVLLLQRKDRTVSNRVGMILLILGLLLGVIYLFLSSLNLVAFFLLVPQVLLLAAMLNFAQTRNVNKANSLRGRVHFLITESRLKEVTAYTLLLLLSWAVIVQGLLLFHSRKKLPSDGNN
ncbi:MAG: hypothetical protein QY318_00950 [Candidatus Dojkabacteria bacterium]|nr:MAG: hypothetical protein QY318_00950 [Candidatus Dojkabacteria bacterium]